MSDRALYRLCVALVLVLALATAGEIAVLVAEHRWGGSWLAAVVNAATVAVLAVVLYRNPPRRRPR